MWMSEPTPVTTRIITAESESTRSVNGIRRSPDDSHVNTVCDATRGSGPAMAHTAAADMPKETTIAAQAIPPDTAFGSRLPRKAFTTKPSNGSNGISSSISPLQRGKRVGTQRLAMAEQRDDDRQTHGRLRRGDRHD